MLGSALYFPHIDIRDPAWLRSSILFWDEIQTIAPSAIEHPYQTEDTIICSSEGYLKPLRCDLHQNIIDELGRKIIGLSDRRKMSVLRRSAGENPAFGPLGATDEVSWEIEDALREVGMYPEKMSPEIVELAMRFGLARMHRGKVPPELRHMFRELEMAQMHPEKMSSVLRHWFDRGRRFNEEDGEWLLVNGRFADAYMAALAAHLSKQLELSPLTSRERAHGLSFRFMFDEIVDCSSDSAKGAMISVVMRGLKVDSSVPVSKLIKFKENRKDQYKDFSGKISELSAKIENAALEPGSDLFREAKTSYENNIEPCLRALKRELDLQSISTIWEGAYRAITISVPSAGALAYFTGLAGPALLGAGAALAAADIGVRGYLAGRKIRGGNPYSYLHDINANFGLPDFVDA